MMMPRITDALIQYLKEKYPDRSPDPKDSDREIWMKAGEARLVRDLVNLKQAQEDHPEDYFNNVHP